MASTSGHEKDETFVIVSEAEAEPETGSKEGTEEIQTYPKIYDLNIEAKVRNRFAHSTVTSKVRNLNRSAKETDFSVILPEKAFISEFVMIIGEKSYKAYVKKKEEAQQIYDQAVRTGTTAAQVTASARDSNRFDVSVNVEPLSVVTFNLVYEELLKRKENMYELIVNIHPKQLVENLSVNVFIDESRPLKFITTPALRSGNEIGGKEVGDLVPEAEINQFSRTSAVIRFKPSAKKQKEIATIFGTKIEEGFAGQFVVQYDVERDPNGGEVLVQDGYFIHFFAPDNVKPLNKYIIFVLDISSSMVGEKTKQLKQAMHTILQQLGKEDYFHIICFESNIIVWNVQDYKNSAALMCISEEDERLHDPSDFILPRASSADQDNILKAKEIVEKICADGGTNIYGALETALHLIQREKNSNLPQPMIMFLTDGDPTTGETNTDVILSDITKFNEENVAIFTLSFGEDADKLFLKKLAQKNHAFSRHIYEASDAALQLQNFYKEIASPLLSNVKFEYMPDTTSLTKTTFPLHFGGGEIVVSGRLNGETFPEVPRVKCCGRNGPVVLQSELQRPVTSLERLWAYLSVQQLLDESEIAPDKTVIGQRALDLALQYSFVTPVTSLVVVKPDSDEFSVDPESASKSILAEEDLRCTSSLFSGEIVELVEEVCLTYRKVKKRKTRKMCIPELEAPGDIQEIAVGHAEGKPIKRIGLKKRTGRKLEPNFTCSLSDEDMEESVKIQKCNRSFLWTLVGRYLITGAIFRVSFFVSLFFYFLIM